MLTRINIFSVLMTLNLFTISFGSLAPVNARSYGLFAFLLMVVFNTRSIFQQAARHPIRICLQVLGMLICIGVILTINRPYVWLFWYVPLLFLFFHIGQPHGEYPSQMYLVWTAFVLACCYVVCYHSPHVWWFLQTLSTQGSRLIGDITGTAFVLGATGTGFWIFYSCLLCLFFAYVLHAHESSSRRATVAIAAAYLGIGYFAYTAYGHHLFQDLHQAFIETFGTVGKVAPNFAATSMSAPLLFLAIAVGVTIVFVPQLLSPKVQQAAASGSLQMKICAVSGLIAVVATLLFYLPFTHTAPSMQKARVTFYGKGLLSWDTPQVGSYGTIASGMFGLFPKYLHSMGYQTLTLNREEKVTPNILEETDVFVVINLDTQFSDEEQQMVWEYVSEGGSLLVLGDHTDLEGTMEPLNHLLEPVNIKFRFDSAFTATRWFNAYELFPHPMTVSLDYSNDTLQHSTGASLDIAPPASPIINAKFAFSDKGNYANNNGYLGDYLYQPGEQFGDLAVVAGATYGNGKVVVFGDTSGFQNLPLYHSHEMMNRLFSYLTLPISFSVLKSTGIVLLLGVVFAYLLIPSARTVLALPSLAVALGIGLFIGHFLLPLSAPTRANMGNIAYVDAGHINQYALKHWQEDSINGLTLNLARNGYLPMVRRAPVDKSIFYADVYIVIAPNQSFTPRELELLKTYMSQGGLLVLSVGWEEKAGAQSLLDLLAIDIAPIPLGPVPVYEPTHDDELIEAMQRAPHFMEAWPISYQDASQLSVLYGFGDYPIVVHKRFGSGSAIVIADTQYLYNRTLEAEKSWWEGNIIFFKQLLEFGLSGGIDR